MRSIWWTSARATSKRPSTDRSTLTAEFQPSSIPPAREAKPLALFEMGAILIYLAEKTGKLMPADPAPRYETLQWLFFQIAAMGPMFGQLGYFHKFAGREIEDKPRSPLS